MNLKRILVFGVLLGMLALMGACTAPGSVDTVATSEPKTSESSETETDDSDADMSDEDDDKAGTHAEDDDDAADTHTEDDDDLVTAQGDDNDSDSPGEAQEAVDLSNPVVNGLLNQITLVQHHHNVETGVDTFTCASRGKGVKGVEPDPEGPRFVGPNSGDFDLWGAVALFKVDPDGTITFVPQQTGGKFLDPDGVEQDVYTLDEALGFAASGDATWSGAHGEAGRVAECDPQYPKEN